MTLLNDLALRELQFYLTAPYPCSYLPGRMARSLVAAPNELVDTAAYTELIRIGFRRSGVYNYRPQCGQCRACVPVRLLVDRLEMSRTQRRAWNRHGNLTTAIRELSFDPEHYALYRRYQSTRHAGGGMDQDSQEQYCQFLLTSHVDTHLIEFREGAELRMVSVVDVLANGLSSVYTFYEPDMPQASYGTYNVLWQAQLCRELNKPYLYLGYWIENSAKMAYKMNFRPLEGLVDDAWRPLP
jgi:arginyl-tRNA--protein-N-Asp/Glu arginylyltransferase